MSTLTIRILESLCDYVREIAKREGISINRCIGAAVEERILDYMTEEYLDEKAVRGDSAKFEKALSRIKNIEAERIDRMY